MFNKINLSLEEAFNSIDTDDVSQMDVSDILNYCFLETQNKLGFKLIKEFASVQNLSSGNGGYLANKFASISINDETYIVCIKIECIYNAFDDLNEYTIPEVDYFYTEEEWEQVKFQVFEELSSNDLTAIALTSNVRFTSF